MQLAKTDGMADKQTDSDVTNRKRFIFNLEEALRLVGLLCVMSVGSSVNKSFAFS